MASKFFRGGKFAYEMLVPTVKKNLTKRRADFEDLVKTTDKYTKNLTSEGKIKVKEAVQPAAKKISGIHDKYEKKIGPGSSNPKAKTENKAKGGRVGLKFGTKKKSNIQRIKETFGPGSSNPKKSAVKKKKSFPDLNKDGKVTFADILKGRGVKRG